MKNDDPRLQAFLTQLDHTAFTTENYQQRVEKPWGYELLFTGPGSPYTAKIMHINAGCRQSLQIHDAKSETYTVIKGRAAVIVENKAGEIVQIELQPEHGFTTQVGQEHRLIGLTDCDIFEASTPETGTTWRLEDDYARPDETEALRQQPDRGWKD